MSASTIYMAEPPNSQIRHTTNPPNLHKGLIAVGVSTTTLAFVAVVLRIFTRSRVTRNGVHPDDYMVLCAMVFSLVLLGCNFPHMSAGLGYHIWEVKAETYMSPFQTWTLVGTVMYATSLAFTKLSILLFYLRLSPHTWFRILVHILAAAVIIYATVYNLISIFGCRPLAASWDLRLVPSATCVDQLTKYIALSIPNIVIDVFTLVLPIPVIAQLQMPRKQKISVCAIFATGSFVCVVAIRRTTLLEPLMVSSDYTWNAVEQFQWCFAEVNAAILCACAPALKPFFVRYLPGLLNSHFRSHNHDDELSKTTDPDSPATSASRTYNQNRIAKNAYEMQWRDDLTEETFTTKRSGSDNEAQLWKGYENDKVIATRDESADQMKMVDKPSIKTHVQSAVTSPASIAPSSGDTLRYSTSDRIHVTPETSVTYSSS